MYIPSALFSHLFLQSHFVTHFSSYSKSAS